MKRNKTKKIVISLLCFGILCFYLIKKSTSKKPVIEAVVKIDQIKSHTQYKGILKPSLTYWYNAEFNKEIVWRIETGVEVKKGDPVLKFQTTDLEEEVESHVEGIVDKEATLAGIVLQNQSEIDRAELETKEMALRVEIEKFNFESAKCDPSDLIKEEQDLILKKDLIRKTFIESKYKTNLQLFEKGLVSETSLQTSKVNLVRAESDYLKTNIRYKDRLAGVTDLRLKRLEKLLELAILKYQDTLANEKNLREIHRLNEIRVKEDIFSIKNKVDRYKKNIESSTIKAPFDSKVYFPSIYKGSASNEPIEIGETPIKGVGLLFFTDSEDFDVDFIVAESDLKNISMGANIDFDLKSNQSVKMKGEIYKLSEIASDKNILLGDLALERKGEANVRVVQVTAKLKSGHSDLRQGITGTVFLTEIGSKCMVIPQNAVKVINGKNYVITKKLDQKEVSLGKNDGFMVEVLAGLAIGDVILND